MEEFAEISQAGALVIFAGLAVISLTLMWWILAGRKTGGRGRARLALGGVLIGAALAGGGFLWFRAEILDLADNRAVVAALYAPYHPAKTSEGGALIWHRTVTEFNSAISFARLAGAFPGLSIETYDDFLTRNVEDMAVDPGLELGYPHMLIDEAGARKINAEDAIGGLTDLGWFGIYSHSRPGFNNDHSEALIYHATICGLKCGIGQMRYFIKKDGRWQEAGSYGLWVG